MHKNGSDRRPGTWGRAHEVFDRLVGAWTLHREITGGIVMQGSAVFVRLPDGLLKYHEEGRLRLADGKEFDGFRDYLFGRTGRGFTVYFAETPMRVFHDIAIAAPDDGGSLVGTASHLCVADTYDSRYLFHPDGSFAIEHTVTGPNKDYVTRTRFTRQP